MTDVQKNASFAQSLYVCDYKLLLTVCNLTNVTNYKKETLNWSKKENLAKTAAELDGLVGHGGEVQNDVAGNLNIERKGNSEIRKEQRRRREERESLRQIHQWGFWAPLIASLPSSILFQALLRNCDSPDFDLIRKRVCFLRICMCWVDREEGLWGLGGGILQVWDHEHGSMGATQY